MRLLKYLFIIVMSVSIFPTWANSSLSNFDEVPKLIIKACSTYNFDANWAFIIFNDESYHLKNVVVCEPKYVKKYNKCIKAYGVPQILYRTACAPEVYSTAIKTGVPFSGDENELLKNEVSIPLGIIYLAHLKKVYNGDMEKVLSHYKSGKSSYKAPYERLYPKYQQFTTLNLEYIQKRIK